VILQIRLFRLVWELLWVKGFLVGFTLPDRHFRALGVTLGLFTICIYPEPIPSDCTICERPLDWGLHGKLGKWKLCRKS
jgi:hypothetical protein